MELTYELRYRHGYGVEWHIAGSSMLTAWEAFDFTGKEREWDGGILGCANWLRRQRNENITLRYHWSKH